ncbi:MAG: hypothetical protein ABSG41_00850 [Bryobacteraceae bacterium]|jgi:hypothetical protein
MFDSGRVRALIFPILSTVFGASLFAATDLSTYRGMQFGMDLAVAAKQADMKPADAKVVHERPDLIQEIDWQPRASLAPDPVKADPVRDALLSFFNGQLFRIVVMYDSHKIEGMSADDMIDAISVTYGVATRPEAAISFHSNFAEVARVVARWEGPEYSCDLVRTGDQASFAMVLYSKPLAGLAEASTIRAVRLEAQEAPQREIEKQKKREDAERLVLENARSVNRPNFQP